jgi:cobalt/nickel transport system permease protein
MHQLSRYKLNYHHPFTRIDPRVKLICTLTLLVMVISSRGFIFPMFMAAASIALCMDLGIRPKALLARFAEPLFIASMVVLLKLFCSGSLPLFSFHIWGMEISGQRDGLLEGLLIASRIGGAVSLVSLLGFSTSFTDLMAAFSWMRAPSGLVEVALFAWRYLFDLFEDAQVVYAAQRNRLGYTGFLRGLRSFGTLAGALVIKAFDNSQTITTAMTQRGYDGTMPLAAQKPLRISEWALSMTFLLAMGIIWRI